MATPCHSAWHLVSTMPDHQVLTDHQEDSRKTGRGRSWICQVSHHHVRGANGYYIKAALVCQAMLDLYHNHGLPRLIYHCQSGEHLGGIWAVWLAPFFRNSYTLQIPVPRAKGWSQGARAHILILPIGLAPRPRYCNSSVAKIQFESPFSGIRPPRPQRSPITEPPNHQQCPVFCTQPRAAPKGPQYILLQKQK